MTVWHDVPEMPKGDDDREAAQKDEAIKMEDSIIDWNKEYSTLGESGDYWTVPQGKNTVVFLDDGEPITKNFDGEEKHQVKFTVDVKESGGDKRNTVFWTVNRGGKNSLFGQIATVASKNGGKLKDAMITVVRKGTGKTDTSYTVLEALEE